MSGHLFSQYTQIESCNIIKMRMKQTLQNLDFLFQIAVVASVAAEDEEAAVADSAKST